MRGLHRLATVPVDAMPLAPAAPLARLPAGTAPVDSAPVDSAPVDTEPMPSGPVLAAVDDSPLAVPVVQRAARLAATTGRPLLVATVFGVRTDPLTSLLPATLEAFGVAAAALDRVRPLLDRLGVPYPIDVRGCSGRGGPRRRARRVANQLLRIRADVAGVSSRTRRRSGRSARA